MPKKRLTPFRIVFFGVSILIVIAILIGFIINLPVLRDWQLRRSIAVIEGGQHVFDDTRQFSGNFKQSNLYYWSPKHISDAKLFYQDFTIAPFVEVNTNSESWLIAPWRGSKIINAPIRKPSLHTDFCDYHKVYDCMSIVLLDASQSSLPNILRSMYSTSTDEIQSLPSNGTLIVFSYDVPDPS